MPLKEAEYGGSGRGVTAVRERRPAHRLLPVERASRGSLSRHLDLRWRTEEALVGDVGPLPASTWSTLRELWRSTSGRAAWLAT